MECINHAGQMASGTCQSCGKALCTECANRFSPPLCERCLLQNNNNVTNKLILDVALTVIVGVIICILVVMKKDTSIQMGLFIGFYVAGGWWGWQLLNKVPMPILVLPIPAAFLFYGFKASISMGIGFFVMPIVMFLRIIKIFQINKLKREVLAGKA